MMLAISESEHKLAADLDLTEYEVIELKMLYAANVIQKKKYKPFCGISLATFTVDSAPETAALHFSEPK